MKRPDASRRRGRLDLLAPLRSPRCWRIALVVGTLINLYGQLLVPLLSGEPQPLAGFAERATHHPGTTALSVLLGYLFPLGVIVYAAAGARDEDTAG